MSTTILIADDHPLFRQALSLAVMQAAPGARIVEAGTLDRAAAAAAAAAEGLSLILLDLNMPGAVGYSGVALLHAEVPDVPILVVSGAERAAAFRQVARFGAVGFVGKDAGLAEIEAAIAAALAGERMTADAAPDDDVAARVASLTPMQLRVLLGVLAGRLNKQIAHDLGIAEATVKAHMTAVLRKLDVGNRTQAALAAGALGLEVAG